MLRLVAGGDELLQPELLEVVREVVEEVADARVVTVAVDDLALEVLLCSASARARCRRLRVELIFLGHPRTDEAAICCPSSRHADPPLIATDTVGYHRSGEVRLFLGRRPEPITILPTDARAAASMPSRLDPQQPQRRPPILNGHDEPTSCATGPTVTFLSVVVRTEPGDA